MPGLLFEAELPPEAKRPGVPRTGKTQTKSSEVNNGDPDENTTKDANDESAESGDPDSDSLVASQTTEDPIINIPLAIAKVYNLQVTGIPLVHLCYFNMFIDVKLSNFTLEIKETLTNFQKSFTLALLE